MHNQLNKTLLKTDRTMHTHIFSIDHINILLLLLQERIVLQTVRWRMRVDIAVDPDMPLGSRASLVGRPYQEQPHILNYQEPIPPNALGRPNANDAQVLMWRPRRGAPLVVIPPK